MTVLLAYVAAQLGALAVAGVLAARYARTYRTH